MEGKLRDLWAESRELSLGTAGAVDRLDAPPSSLCFLRDYVSPSKPCLISRSATLHWPALSHSLWSDAYLSRALADRPVSVHLTPDGRADSLAPLPSTTALCFASPCVQPMPIKSALRLIASRTSPLVAYAQQQNDCFRGEYSPLAGDVDTHIPFATDALGCLPEAVNLWIGSARSETSFHKDHYENLYVVITGEKHFLLLPPTDVHRLYVRHYPAARYSDSDSSQGELKLELEVPSREVPWCSVDPYPRSLEEIRRQRSAFPLYFEGGLRPIECTVKAGEILYLPSMWFHHVRQTPDRDGRTIAINYWYDMQFDIKYAYFNFLQSIQCSDDDDVLQSIQCPNDDDNVLQSIQCPDVALQSIQCPDDDDDVLQSIQCPDDDVVLQSIQCPDDDDDVLQSIKCPDDDDVMQLRNNTSSDHLESEENIHTASS